MKKKTTPESQTSKYSSTKTNQTTKPSNSPAHKWIYIALALYCIILYINTIPNDFSLDDELVTWNNPLVSQGIKAIPRIFTSPYVEVSGNAGTLLFGYRPMAKATFAIEHSLTGGNPHVSHFINLLLYIATALLLYRILARMFQNLHYAFPLVATLIFVAHPTHTEVVASLKNREELMALLGALGGLWYFLKYAETNQARHIGYALLSFFLGYLSKSSVMPFLALYPLTLWMFTSMEKRKIILLAVLSLGVLLIAQLGPAIFLPDTIRPNAMIENPLFFEKNILRRAATGFTGLLHYLKLMIWPHPLLFYYGYDTFPVTGWGNLRAILSLLLHATLFVLALLNFKKRPLLAYGILFYLIGIAMYSNVLVPVVGIVGDRFTYLASIGFAITAAWLIFSLIRIKPEALKPHSRFPGKIILPLLILLVPYTLQSFSRNQDWKNLETLYKADIDYLPRSVKANTQYAGNLLYNTYQAMQAANRPPKKEIIDEMIRHYELSLKILPTYYDALTGLGTVYSTLLGEHRKAIPYFEAALKSDSLNVAGYINLAFVWRQLGDNKMAKYFYSKVLQRDSTKVKAYFKLAEIYFEEGNKEEAIRLNLLATRFDPYTDVPYLNIGNYHLLSKDTLTAVEWYEKAAEKQPNHELSMKLYMHYTRKGDAAKAAYYKKMAEETRNVVTVPAR
ncbi:MAG: tetratricopeptide repeat protein [Bacteroidales bacterium]